MNRECSCKHSAKNISVDPFNVKIKTGEIDPQTNQPILETKRFPYENMEANVQNALELLFSDSSIESVIGWLEGTTFQEYLNRLTVLEEEVVPEDRLKEIISEIIYGVKIKKNDGYIMENILYNPFAYIDGESLYYQDFLTSPKVDDPYEIDGNNTLFPDFNDDGVVDEEDLDIFQLIYEAQGADLYSENGYSEDRLDHIKDTIDNMNNINITIKNNLKTRFDNGKRILEYDLQLLKEFIETVENERPIPIDEEYSDGVVPAAKILTNDNIEDFNYFLKYKSPFGWYGMPNLCRDTEDDAKYLNSKDTGRILVVSANTGAGNDKVIWNDYLDARTAARVAKFAADFGAGVIRTKYRHEEDPEFVNTAEYWKRYILDCDETVKSLYVSLSEEEDSDDIKIKVLSQDEYDNLSTKSNKILYVIVEEE